MFQSNMELWCFKGVIKWYSPVILMCVHVVMILQDKQGNVEEKRESGEAAICGNRFGGPGICGNTLVDLSFHS